MRFVKSMVGGGVVLLALAGAGWAAQPTPVDHSELTRRTQDGWVLLEGEPFTGVAERHYETGALAERVSYRDGRKDGVSERWFVDGTRSYRATYSDNRRHGTVETWWEDGTRRSRSQYDNGVADGTQREWYRSGAPFKELNLEQGQEVGLQRAWRENGKLYANYEARDGRTFGLKRADLCFQLDDEETIEAFMPAGTNDVEEGGGA